MAARRQRISILRPLIITVSALVLALVLERFTFPSIPFSLSAGNSQFRAVYSELAGSESTLWAADPTEPLTRRKRLLAVSHAYGYGIVASVSPDGSRLAYGFLPEGRRDAFSDGQLWVSSIDGQGSRLISGKMDLHFSPIWSPDGKSILFKTVEPLPEEKPLDPPSPDRSKTDQRPLDLNFQSSLVVASIERPAATRAIVSLRDPNLYPIGWSPDGKDAYYYTVEAEGTQAHSTDVTTSETQSLGKLAGGPVWDVKLSPDRRQLLFLTVQSSQSGLEGAAWIFDTDNRQVSNISAPQLGPLGATWHPSGNSVTRNSGQSPSLPGQSLLDTTIADGISRALKEESDSTVNIPVSWSPDSTYLAIRRRSISTSDRLDNLAILDSRSGQMKEIKGGYAEFVGWTTVAR